MVKFYKNVRSQGKNVPPTRKFDRDHPNTPKHALLIE